MQRQATPPPMPRHHAPHCLAIACPPHAGLLLRLDLLVRLDSLDVLVALQGVDGALVENDPVDHRVSIPRALCCWC